MGTANGTAILTFGDSARTARYIQETITVDSHPSPSTWKVISLGPNNTVSNWNLYYLNNRILAIIPGFNTDTIYSSIDGGVTWQTHIISISSQWTSITYDGTRYVIVSDSILPAYYSTDLSSWNSTSDLTNIGIVHKVVVFDELNNAVVAIGAGTSYYLTVGSSTWTLGGNLPTGTSARDAIYNPTTQYVLVGQSAVSNTAFSTNAGVSWSAAQPLSTSRTTFRLKIDTNENMVYATTNGVGNVQVCDGSTLSGWMSVSHNPPLTTASLAIGVGGPNLDVVVANRGSTNHIPIVFKGQNAIVSPVQYPTFPAACSVGDILYVPSYNYYIAITSIGILKYSSPATNVPGNTRTTSNVNIEIESAKSVVGSSTAAVSVTGQTDLLATDYIDAWIQATDSTVDHNAIEHKLSDIKLSVTNIQAGVGFDIIGMSDSRLTGDFKVRWARAS